MAPSLTPSSQIGRIHATPPKGSLIVHVTEGTSMVKLDTTGVQP